MKNKGYLFLLIVVLTSCNDNYDIGQRHLKKGNFKNAAYYFKKVQKENEFYDSAQIKISEIEKILTQIKQDSLRHAEVTIKEKQKQDSLNFLTYERREINRIIDNLNYELKTIELFNPSRYRETLDDMEKELKIFRRWQQLNKDAKLKVGKDKELDKLERVFFKNATKFQKNEFPLLRKAFAEFLNKEMWKENITVKTTSSDHSSILFIGAEFANNRNIEDTQKIFREKFNNFRFKKSAYKWNKYDEEYTYYTMTPIPDTEL